MVDIESGNYTASQVHRMERYKALMAQVAEQLRDLQGLTRQEMEQAERFGIQLGGEHARGLIAATLEREFSGCVQSFKPGSGQVAVGVPVTRRAIIRAIEPAIIIRRGQDSRGLDQRRYIGIQPYQDSQIFRRAWD